MTSAKWIVRTDEAFRFAERCYEFWGLPMDSPLFVHILREWMVPTGFFKNTGIQVYARIQNASGRSDTALLNAFINFFVQLAAYITAYHGKTLSEVTQVELEWYLKHFRIAVLGDDSITFTLEFDDMANKVADQVARFGFETRDMKVHDDPRNLTFLGCHVYPVKKRVGDEWVQSLAFGPTIGRRSFKMGVATDIQSDPLDWLRQTSQATLKVSGFVPIVSDIARRQIQLLDALGVVDSGKAVIKEVVEQMKYKNHLMDDSTLIADSDRMDAFMEAVYGLNPVKLRELNAAIQRVPTIPCYITSPILDRLVIQDTV